MDKIARIDKDTWCSGLFLDQKQQIAPLWVDASNVIFENAKMGPFPGSVSLFTREKTGVVTGLQELSPIVTGEKAIVFGYLDSLYIWDASTGITEVGTGFTGNIDQTADESATRWSIQQFNEWIVATNGKDPMQLLKVVGTGFSAMTSATSTQFKKAEIIKKHKQFLLAFNLELAAGTKQGNAIAWCDINDVETWVPTTSNAARKIFIPDLESDIKCAEKFGEFLFAYSDNSVHAIEYKGYPNVYEPTPLPRGVGVYGKNCVAEVKGIHIGIGPRGIWQFNGTSFEYIDNPQLRKYIAGRLDKNQASKIVVYNDQLLNHVMFFMPEASPGENVFGVAFNYRESKWTKLAFSRSAAVDAGIFGAGVSSDTNGNVYLQTLDQLPASNNEDATLRLTTGGIMYLGYGDPGYGDTGYGGIDFV